MADPGSLSQDLCGCRAGTILLRACGNPATGLCSDCALPLCPEHQRSYRWLMLCPACFAQRQQETEAADSEDSGYGPASRGGIAGESFDEGTEEPLTEEFGDSPFTEEDYAAFDAVSDYDRKAERGGGYDS